jgi:hypothetical protein
MYLAPIRSANFPKLWPGGQFECRLYWRLKGQILGSGVETRQNEPKALRGAHQSGCPGQWLGCEGQFLWGRYVRGWQKLVLRGLSEPVAKRRKAKKEVVRSKLVAQRLRIESEGGVLWKTRSGPSGLSCQRKQHQ